MTTQERLEKFAQKVYLTRYGRYIDDIDDTDGQVDVEKTIDWTNMFVEELELEADWNYVTRLEVELGTIDDANTRLELPDESRKLVVSEYRPLVIKQDGAVVSQWEVVDPKNLTVYNRYSTTDQRVTWASDGEIIFSRPLTEFEIGGTAYADVVDKFPELTATNVDLLDLVKPQALLIQGAAKNATLPDIVQGGLSPSFTQKYNDLLEKAVAENNARAASTPVYTDDFSNITGVY